VAFLVKRFVGRDFNLPKSILTAVYLELFKSRLKSMLDSLELMRKSSGLGFYLSKAAAFFVDKDSM